MRKQLAWKALAVGGLVIALLMPLSMVEGLVQQRNARQEEARTKVAESAAGKQQLIGPVLVQTYVERLQWEEKDEKTGKVTERHEDLQKQERIVPKDLTIDGEAEVEQRNRGLFKAQLFHLNAKLSGRFVVPPGFGIDASRRSIALGRAYLVLGLPDLRGIQNRPVLTLNGRPWEFQTGGAEGTLARGIRVDLGALDLSAMKDYRFEIPLELMGSETFSVAPVAEMTRMTLRSGWPNPSFSGRFLPVKRQVTEKGFTAAWQVSDLARNLDEIVKGDAPTTESFAVSFIEPVNIYSQSERAVKYGALFVGLTFAAFFFFEVLRRLPIHPIQYLLVGLSLALFFLLLVSLSERLPFLVAYLSASGACIALLGTYLVHVLRNRRYGLGFATGLTLLYGALYGLIVSEDNALLMGSLMLFGLLAAVMVGTRRLDWYQVSAGETGAAEGAS